VKKLPTFLDDREPELLLRATETERDRMLLFLMLFLGLRVSEVTKLEIRHLDFSLGFLWVREGKGKKDRCLPIPKKLVGPLRAWVGFRKSGYVFVSPRGGKLAERSVQMLMKRLAVRAGLVDANKARRVTPHKLRHAFCTRLLNAGVPVHEVRDLMGHSSIAVTDRYSHASPEHLRRAVERAY
jgi:site-specific recombinase XerD